MRPLSRAFPTNVLAMSDRDLLPHVPQAPPPSSPAARAIMQGNRKVDTRPEQRLRSLLHRAGLRYRVNATPEPALRCRADVVFSRARIAVFVDGCFWHGCPEHGVRPRTHSHYWDAKLARNVARDRRNDTALEAAGWTVVHVWEHEPPAEAAERVSRLVSEKRARLRDRPSTSAPRG